MRHVLYCLRHTDSTRAGYLLARAVTDIKPLLKSDKANGARMHTATGLAATQLTHPDGIVATPVGLPSRRGRAATSGPHPFAVTPLRHLLFAIRETAAADNSPEPGRQYLRDTFGRSIPIPISLLYSPFPSDRDYNHDLSSSLRPFTATPVTAVDFDGSPGRAGFSRYL